MSIPFILIRTDALTYLQDLQEGKLFMRTSLYYQNMEADDLARKDHLDGSIPDSGKYFKVSLPPEIGPIRNSRFTEMNCYIKCFHQYSLSDLHRIDEHTLALEFSEETRNSLRAFGNDYAMILLGDKFIQQFKHACESKGFTCGCGSICYMNEEQYATHEAAVLQYVNDRNQGKPHPAPQPRPTLCKPDVFRAQQEYRVFLFYETEEAQEMMGKGVFILPDKENSDKAFGQPYVLNVGSLKEISLIVPISSILDNPLYIRVSEDGTIAIAPVT